MAETGGAHRTATVLGLVGLVVLGGCVSVTVESNVASDGTIEKHTIELRADQSVYQRLNERANNSGYEGLEGQLKSNFDEENYRSISFSKSTATDSEGTTRVTARLVVRGYEPDAESPIDVSTNETHVTYVREVERSNSQLSSADITYKVQMPGEITESNADRVFESNNTAVWRPESSITEQTFRVTSERGGGGLGLSNVPVAPIALVVVLGGFGAFLGREAGIF